jgi:rhodanese-related sulfurtransferase
MQLPVSNFPAWRDALKTGGAEEPLPVVLDVREPWEVQTATLKEDGFKLVCIPMREVPARLAELNEDQPVACLCHHGMRSLQVANYLVQNGFTQVVNLQGGIDAWSSEVDPSVPRY